MITRIISGIIGILGAIFVVQSGGNIYNFAIVILASIAWNEYSKMMIQKNGDFPSFVGVVGLFFIINTAFYDYNPAFGVMTSITLLAFYLVIFKNINYIPNVFAAFFGTVYIGLPLYYMVALRNYAPLDILYTNSYLGDFSLGTILLWLCLIGTWASDTFAYFVGVFFGKRKLSKISPKKSVEGFIGGILGSMLCVTYVGAAFNFNMNLLIFMGFGIAAIGTLGDLVESSIKRYVGVKDSGYMIPGHGGVLDRFDSLFFTIPFVYLMTLFL